MSGIIHLFNFVCTSPPSGFLGQCLENLLFDNKFWLSSLEDDVAIKISIEKDTLNLIYKSILMQEGTVGDNALTVLVPLKLLHHGAVAD